jgi:sugar lactone lactonase YvrE
LRKESIMKVSRRIGFLLFLLAQLELCGFAQHGIITTFTGDNLPAKGTKATAIDITGAVAADNTGGFYISNSQQNKIYRVAKDGSISLTAGVGTGGFSGDGGLATAAQLKGPSGIAVDSAGNLYIVDKDNNRIRKVTTAGIISTVAGGGTSKYSDGLPATAAQLKGPSGIAVDSTGNLYIVDKDNNRIHKVTAAGIISTVAGGGTSSLPGDGGQATAVRLEPNSIAVDSAGNIYFAEERKHRIRKVTSEGIINTVAGNGNNGNYGFGGYRGDGGLATAAQLGMPSGVAVDSAGNLYIADAGGHQSEQDKLAFNRIRKVTSDGIISTVAGNANPDYGRDGGTATEAHFDQLNSVAADSAGNLYIADLSRIRKVTSKGTISTVAGRSLGLGDGGPATSAKLYSPSGVALDSAGNLFIADTESQRIRKVTKTGIISTVAGSGIKGYNGDEGPATAAQLNKPFGVAVDSAGNLYIADTGNDLIRKVTRKGIISTMAGGGTISCEGRICQSDGGPATAARLYKPSGVVLDSAGNLYITEFDNKRIYKVTTEGIISMVASSLLPAPNNYTAGDDPEDFCPLGVAVDSAGNIYIADLALNRIQKITSAGAISTVAGFSGFSFKGDGLQSAAMLRGPRGMAVDSSGNIYIPDRKNSRIRKITIDGTISTVAGSGTKGNSGRGNSGDGGLATAAQLFDPTDVALDSAGNLYIADEHNGRIRKVTPAGIISTVAGHYASDSEARELAIAEQLKNPGSVALDSAGNLYITDSERARIYKVTTAGVSSTVAGNGKKTVPVGGSNGDGGPATEAQIGMPTGIAVDSAGNLFIVDNGRIRKVTAAGIISTVAGGGTGKFSDGGPATAAPLFNPNGVAVDSAGNLYIAESGDRFIKDGMRIRKVTPAGIISTIAGNGSLGYSGDGGPATAAQLNVPNGVAVDSAGNLYITDSENARIRKVTPEGIISTIAGNGTKGFSGDGGPATEAQLKGPGKVAIDSAGNIYIADLQNQRIRKVTPEGIISTVAGNGTIGCSGDGGPGTAAQLNRPTGVAVDSAGNLYIADSMNARIRKVAR